MRWRPRFRAALLAEWRFLRPLWHDADHGERVVFICALVLGVGLTLALWGCVLLLAVALLRLWIC